VKRHLLVLGGLCLVLAAPAGVRAQGAATSSERGSTDTAAVQRVVDGYIGLYTKERLPEWKALFLPGFTATYTNADGSITTRTLEEFYESQRAGFARAAMTETLHDVRITRAGRLAHVFAGFDFTSGGNTRRGRLMLLMIEAQGQYRIAALTFTYHLQ
jgi:SnoaL-like domain